MAQELPQPPASEQPPVTQPAQAPPAQEPAKVPADQSADVKKYAAIFARHPETFEGVLAELEHSGVVAVRQEVQSLRLELDIRDALTEHGLTKEDIPFIKGSTRDEIMGKAAALRARLGAVTPPAAKDGKPATEPAKAPPAEVPPLPEHRGTRSSLETAEANLLESAREWTTNFSTDRLGHLG